MLAVMGWKIVRDDDEKLARAAGVSGVWRPAANAVHGLLKKIFEEAGEYAEHLDPAELYDLLDVVEALIDRVDPAGKHAAAHAEKVTLKGAFSKGIEWSPNPNPDYNG
jgi:predicted house-cleaning noncanonical NTP pyrophosphatase (MazG superfamily)